MNPELRLITRPGATYAALVAAPERVDVWTMFRRPALVGFVLGCAVAMAGTRHVTVELLIGATLYWSVLVVAQVLIALAVFGRAASRTVGIARGLDLFFASHVPWSLWMLAVVAWAPIPGERGLTPVLVAALVPMALTARMIGAFCREVLRMDRRRAIVWTTMHQVVTWGLLIAVFGWAVALWPRILESLQ